MTLLIYYHSILKVQIYHHNLLLTVLLQYTRLNLKHLLKKQNFNVFKILSYNFKLIQ